MSASWDIVQWISIAANVAGTVLNVFVWTIGCVMITRSRPAPGGRFLAIGFGLLAFLSFTSSLQLLGFMLSIAGILDEDVFLMDGPFASVGYNIFVTGLMVTASALIVVGATRALRYSERSDHTG